MGDILWPVGNILLSVILILESRNSGIHGKYSHFWHPFQEKAELDELGEMSMGKCLKYKLRMRESGIYRQYIISYVCVFLLPILILFSMFYAEAMRTVREKLQGVNLATAHGLQTELENGIAEFNHLAVYLDADMNQKQVSSLTYEALQNGDYIRIRAFSEEISRLTSTNETWFSKIYVYFGASDMYVTSNSAQRLEYGYSSLHPELLISKEAWTKQIWDEARGQLQWILQRTDTGFEMYAVKRLPLLGTEKTCSLVAQMNVKRMFYILQATFEKGGAVGIYLADGTPIYVSDEEMLETVWSEAAQAGKYSVVPSEKYGFTVVLSVPEDQWLSDLIRVKRISMATLAFCIVVGAALTVYFAKRHYKPIRNLTRMLGDAGNSGEDEYTQIRCALLKAEEEHRMMDAHSRREGMEKNERYLRRLFNGQEDIAQSGFLANGEDASNLRIILFVFPEDAGEEEADDETMRALQIFEEFLKRTFAAETSADVLTGCSLVLVTVRTGADVLGDEAARLLCERTISFMRENCAREVIALIGSAVQGDADGAVREMRRTYAYVMDFPVEENVLVCAGLPDMRMPENDVNYVEAKCGELVAFMQAGEYCGARARLDLLMERIRTKRILLPESAVVAGLYHDIVSLVLHMKVEERGRVLARLEECFQRFEAADSPTRWDLVREMIAVMENASGKNDRDEGTELAQRVKRIVAREYANQQFCVGRIADELNMPMDVVSRLFKRATMVGPLEYIHQVRVQKAKSLLSERPELTVQEVALQVGYSNVDSFIRAFRRIEDLTPGKFRKNMENPEDKTSR